MKHLIIGKGEIGKAIGLILKCNGYEVKYFDKKKELSSEFDTSEKFDCIHICFGYNSKFHDNVMTYYRMYPDSIVIIHSTVRPGTCENLMYNIKNFVYSPIRGRHKKTLAFHIDHIVRYYSSNTSKAGKAFETIFNSVNIKIKKEKIKSLETAKIMCTTYMYWCLMFQKSLKSYCDKEGLDYKFIYETWNETYNHACDDNIFPARFARPIFDDMPGEIGGHCLVPNIDLIDNEITGILKRFTKSLKK